MKEKLWKDIRSVYEHIYQVIETIDGHYHTYTIECSIQYIDIENGQQAITIDEDRCIEEAYGLLNPYLRELKLTTLGI